MKPQAELKIEMVPTNKLVPYKGNAKVHDSVQIGQIAESIEEFNFADPIAAWHDKNGDSVIIEGHGRLMAAKKLGIDQLPVIYLDYLSDEQRRAYTLVHNKLTMNSGFDEEILGMELSNIFDIDMTMFDFDLGQEEVDTEYHFEDRSDKFTDTLGVFITCKDEADQQRTYEEILEGGYECRLLTL